MSKKQLKIFKNGTITFLKVDLAGLIKVRQKTFGVIVAKIKRRNYSRIFIRPPLCIPAVRP